VSGDQCLHQISKYYDSPYSTDEGFNLTVESHIFDQALITVNRTDRRTAKTALNYAASRGKNQISKHDTFASRCRYVIVLMIYCHFGVCSTISVKRTVFEIYDFKNVVTLKIGLGARQGHWKYHHSIQHIRLPIDVLYNYGSNSCRFWDIQCLKMS